MRGAKGFMGEGRAATVVMGSAEGGGRRGGAGTGREGKEMERKRISEGYQNMLKWLVGLSMTNCWFG